MDASVWGPPLWTILFDIAMKCEADDRQKLKRLMRLLEYNLPCPDCRVSLTSHRKKIESLDIDILQEPVKWLWTVQDMVNQKLDKPPVNIDLVLRRLKAYSCYINDFMIIDTMVVIYKGSKQKYSAEVILTLQTLSELLLHAHRYLKVPSLILAATWEDIDETLFSAKNQMLRLYQMPATSRVEFDQQYTNALSEKSV